MRLNFYVFKVSVTKKRSKALTSWKFKFWHFWDCTEALKKIRNMFVKASHCSQSSLELLDLHGGLLRKTEQSSWPRDCGTPHCVVSTLPIYGAFLILFHTHPFPSLSLGLFHRALQHSLMRGKNTTAMKSSRLLRAFFSKVGLSSPPERFLQIPV